MKRTLVFLFVLLALLASVEVAPGFRPTPITKTTEAPGESKIEIMELVPNNFIRGKIVGPISSQCDAHKVIVYVKKDKWYIHPFERGGDGLSYAKVNKQCEWRINTIKRDSPASEVGFFLVDLNYTPPATLTDVNAIKYKVLHIEQGGERL